MVLQRLSYKMLGVHLGNIEHERNKYTHIAHSERNMILHANIELVMHMETDDLHFLFAPPNDKSNDKSRRVQMRFFLVGPPVSGWTMMTRGFSYVTGISSEKQKKNGASS